MPELLKDVASFLFHMFEPHLMACFLFLCYGSFSL